MNTNNARQYLGLMHHHSLLVLTSLVLEPNSNYSWTQPCHFTELFFHKGVRPRVCIIPVFQEAELFFSEDGSDPPRPTTALLMAPFEAAGVRPLLQGYHATPRPANAWTRRLFAAKIIHACNDKSFHLIQDRIKRGVICILIRNLCLPNFCLLTSWESSSRMGMKIRRGWKLEW